MAAARMIRRLHERARPAGCRRSDSLNLIRFLSSG
jgi:hypothetical protein